MEHSRWEGLAASFRKCICDLHGLNATSSLEQVMQPGLSALKTSNCGQSNEINPACPVRLTKTKEGRKCNVRAAQVELLHAFHTTAAPSVRVPIADLSARP
jgi:hypothetical protein